ncbi:MAG: YebC/PmpR family DNA-binding transcriptional regulator, partial [Steroidobacteraceae bacterium]
MAGHSRWANIQRRSGALAAKRDKERARAPQNGLEAVRFEGYGPGGAAVMVECLTGDRGRTGAEVRRAFVQHGGNLGADGSVSYLFNT